MICIPDNDKYIYTFATKCAIIKKDSLERIDHMDVRVGDKLIMKKNHPCGCNTFDVLRSGMDFKIKCEKCGHEVMVPRSKAEKNIRKIIRPED